MNRNKYFKSVFAVLAIVLMLLPLLSLVYLGLSDLMTSLVKKFTLYVWLDQVLLPLQARLVGAVVKPFIRHLVIAETGFVINGTPINITWNCLGWQSMLLFLGSLIIGFSGRSWTWLSRIETVFFGLLGIFWVNIFRMSVLVLLFARNLSLYKIIFHDYLAAGVTIVYLVFFWWFVYRFVLEEK